MRRLLHTCLLFGCLSAPAAAEPVTFQVSFDAAVRTEPATGRIVVYLIRDGSSISPRATPAGAPFYDDPQPLFGIDVKDLAPGVDALLDDRATAFPAPLSELPPGRYRAQAVLDIQRLRGSWSDEPGNLYSPVVEFTVTGAGVHHPVALALSKVVVERPMPKVDGVEYFEVPSRLLSNFHGRPVTLRAAVLTPLNYDPQRKYPAIYEVPGFGGDHRTILRYAATRATGRLTPDQATLHENVFFIGLDPDSPNGHTLFADSDNNGPCAQALIKELIPALEARYPLIPGASARIVTGHSSGGWSAVWLAAVYPDSFGACFAGAPDPVDFTCFQKADIYANENFYTDTSGADIASNLKDGKVLMTVRQENAVEEVIGPRNTSGQQWDSWQAVFGPRDPADNTPAPLFDAFTGVIDHDIADAYRRFDIAERVRQDPDLYGPFFQRNIRILVGAADEWNLGAAVARLRDALIRAGYEVGDDLGAAGGVEGAGGAGSVGGAITIVPGRDHGTVLRTPQASARTGQMIEVLRKAGHIPAP
jgi:enterochelin esterase-like enzyme